MPNVLPNELFAAAQSREEIAAFVEAFARVNVDVIREHLSAPRSAATEAERIIDPDWLDEVALAESGINPEAVDEAARAGNKYLDIEVALDRRGIAATQAFLSFAGLSDKLRRSIFPVLSGRSRSDREAVVSETSRLNKWLDRHMQSDEF